MYCWLAKFIWLVSLRTEFDSKTQTLEPSSSDLTLDRDED